MNIRKLAIKDAPLMLKWMHDSDVCEFMKANFSEKALQDYENFIRQSLISEEDVHLAVVSDEDECMGTVSLKAIDRNEGDSPIWARGARFEAYYLVRSQDQYPCQLVL